MLTWEELRKHGLGFAFGVGVSVLVGVASDLVGIGSLEDVTVAGLAVTAIRSAASAVVALYASRVPRGD